MMKLLHIELKKTLPYTMVWVILGIYMVFMPLIAIAIDAGIGEQAKMLFGKSTLAFPSVWRTLAWGASWYNLLLGLIIVLLVCNEYAYRTFRQNTIDGLSRGDLLAGKLLLIGAIALFSTAYVFVSGAVLGLIHSEGTEQFFDNIRYVGVYFVQAIAYLSWALLLALLFKRYVLTIIVYLFSLLAEALIRWRIPDEIDRFFPMKVISNLTPMPEFMELIMSGSVNGQPVMQGPDPGHLDLPIHLAIVTGYIVLFALLSYVILNKRNL